MISTKIVLLIVVFTDKYLTKTIQKQKYEVILSEIIQTMPHWQSRHWLCLSQPYKRKEKGKGEL